MSHLDSEAMVDPLFRQTTQKFDEVSMSSLLSSRLSINSGLMLMLDSAMPMSAGDSMQWVESGLGEIGDLALVEIVNE